MSKPTTTTGPYVVTIEGVETRFKTVGAAHDRISASGALILSEDRETVLERLNLGQKVPYTIAEGQTATLHDARTLTVAEQLDFYRQRPVAVPHAPLHPAQAPGAGGEPVTLAQLEENAGLFMASASGAEGGWVSVYYARRQGIDVGGRLFAVVCEHHGNIGGAVTLGQAAELLQEPARFCPDCCGHLARQPKTLEAGLELWQRRALISMALLQPWHQPGQPRGEEELEALSDLELVTAAGFQPMLPALLQSELPAPAADPLDFKAEGMTCTVRRYLKYMDEELEEAEAWGQVREWEAAGKFPEYTRAMRAALGEESDQAPWQWQGMQDPD